MHVSIADLSESELIKRFLSDQIRPSDILQLASYPPELSYWDRVSLVGNPSRERGDIDIFACSLGCPERAVAIEAKRVIVSENSIANDKPYNLEKLGDAVKQANKLARMRFHVVFLYILTAVDTRSQNRGGYTYEGMTHKFREIICSAISRALMKLDPNVGLLELEFTQPMDYPPLSVGSCRAHLRRPARPIAQPAELTKWIGAKVSQLLISPPDDAWLGRSRAAARRSGSVKKNSRRPKDDR